MGLDRISLVGASEEALRRRFFRFFGRCEGGLSPRRTSLLAPSPARLRPATPPCAPTRSARGMSGFWIRQVHRLMGVWTIWASEASARARPAAFRGWNPTPGANHLLKANAGGKLSILSHLGWTPQAQSTYTYRLEACVARSYAARPALSGFRSSGRPSASVARSPPIGVIFPGKGGLFWVSSFLRR